MRIIHDDLPMDQEIAAGFFPSFERAWRRAEIVGRIVLVGFVLVCALGLLGNGPFSEHGKANADDTIRIRYEPVVRFGAPTAIAFDTKVPTGGDKVAVTMSKNLVDLYGLEAITPRASRWEAGQDGIRLEFPVTAGSQRVAIRFAGSPSFRGAIRLNARLDKGEELSWSQYSVP